MPDVKVVGTSGQLQFFVDVSATDLDGDKLALDCKGGTKFTDRGNGTGLFEWLATANQIGGTFSFSCTASDGKLTDPATLTITVMR